MASVAVLAVSGAAAQDVCVDCTGPDRNYRCTIKDSERVQSFRGGSRALEFVCISEIARAGRHQSCRVNTTYSGPCIGQHHEIDLAKRVGGDVVIGRPPAGEGGAEAQSGTPDVPAAAPAPAPAPTPPTKGPPQTVEELAKETVAKSKEQLAAADEQMRKAGDAVGGAVKKTWECVISLFSRC